MHGKSEQCMTIVCVFTMVTARGNKLFLSLFVLVLMDLYRLPEGGRSDRGKAGWVQSFTMLVTLLKRHDRQTAFKEGRGPLMSHCAVLTTHGPPTDALLQCSGKTTLWCRKTGHSRWLSGRRLPVLLCLLDDGHGDDGPGEVS